MIFIFIILLISASLQLHFSDAYSQHVRESYPYHVFVSNPLIIEKMSLEDNVVIYENFNRITDNVEILGLLPEEDSSLRIPNAFSTGTFPKDEQEVVINQEYKENVFGDEKDKDIIGKTIEIDGFPQNFVISAILTSDAEVLQDIYNSDANYSMNSMPRVFVSQKLLSKEGINIPNENNLLTVAYPDLMNHPQDYMRLKNRDALFWETRIDSVLYVMSQVLMIFFLCLLCIVSISYLFLYNTISLDLFMRKKELGYLELFGLNRKRLFRIVYTDYFLKIFLPLMIATLLYYGIMLIAFVKLGFAVFLNPIECLAIICFISFYIFLLVKLPLQKACKKDIITRIKK